MSKRQFKSQASSSRVASGTGFGGFGGGTVGTTLSYLSEPPNLTSISDANVVVAFKNLLKKDSTTKTKGLEDLRAYVQAHPFELDGGVEQPILEAWVKLYPRVAIDNSRRARELSHHLQYELLKSARKRMEKYIPVVVGAWLAGTYDRDRPVARAASDGIASFLDTADKVLMFWRKCQPQILSYAQEAIEEKPETLSDERTVSPDDAQAKYDRVIGASLSLIVNLLGKLGKDDIKKQEEAYDGFLLGNKTLWSFSGSKDAFVRRITDQLLLVCLEKQSHVIEQDLELVSAAFVAEGLRTSQLGSSLPFLQAVTALTSKYPHVWTSAYKGKKSPLSRLRSFVEKGSQAGPPEFWQTLTSLLVKLPQGVLPTDFEGVVGFLKAHRDGISSREELRTNAPSAWSSYFDVVKHLGNGLPDAQAYGKLLSAAVYPIFEQYIRPAPENSRWSMGNSVGALARAFSLCAASKNPEISGALSAEWQRLAEMVVQSMLISLPQQSKDHAKSQGAVVAEVHRWFGLQAEILKHDASVSTVNLLAESAGFIITRAIELIINREGKPYGAASAIEAAFRLTPKLVEASPAAGKSLAPFFSGQLPKLIFSPSWSYLTASLDRLQHLPDKTSLYESAWQSALDALMAMPDSQQKSVAVRALISYHAASDLKQDDEDLQEYLLRSTSLALQGDQDAWSTFEIAVTFRALSTKSFSGVVGIILERLDIRNPGVEIILRGLELLASKQPKLLLAEGADHLTIMTRLLSLTEGTDPAITSRAKTLMATIEGTNSVGTESDKTSPTIAIIRENLETAGPQSLAISTLVLQATNSLENTDGPTTLDYFPRTEQWKADLQPFLAQPPHPSLGVTSMLGGTIPLVRTDAAGLPTQPARDLNGFSIALRMAMYTSKLVGDSRSLAILPLDTQVDILHLQCITSDLANDQLSLQQDNQLWATLSDPDVETEVQDFVSEAQRFLAAVLGDAANWLADSAESQSAVIHKLVMRLIQDSAGSSPEAFYSARLLGTTLSNLAGLHGWDVLGGEKWLSSLDLLKSSTPNVFATSALISGLGESLGSSKLVNTLCNRLVSDVAGAKSNSEKTLVSVRLLNSCISIYEQGDVPVAQNRLVFAVKQITSWMAAEIPIDAALSSAACECLTGLLPCVKGVYGSHWETTFEFISSLWSRKFDRKVLSEWLPAINDTLRLYVVLKSLEDTNDDLEEAIKESAESISEGLLQLLRLPRAKENQPWKIVDERLCRLVAKIPSKSVKEPEEIYPLVASDFRLIQVAAFDVLHRVIPDRAEELSFDVLLEKKVARLPEELLSLLLDAPSAPDYADDILAQFPPAIHSFLLSWHLVFDSYTKASYKIRNDYTDQLKSGDYVTPLLNFLFEVLGHAAAQPLNIDKAPLTQEQIKVYDYKYAGNETDEYNMQWLLVNLYFQALTHIPALVKTWWIDCKSKQTRIAVESWTEKFFSPIVIDETLDGVSKWAEEQEPPAEDEKELIVKVSKKSREVYAGYEVDEMQMQIVIRLPHAYPLEGVKVEGINRVAASEKKWQSWLIITQGAITFSNGSIISGLSTFRKNVTGALKGQTECAICYSIVSSDKKMPDKRCGTCKNLFHSTCLFKWFASSNQSTCPLCRNPFNYGASDHGAGRGRR